MPSERKAVSVAQRQHAKSSFKFHGIPWLRQRDCQRDRSAGLAPHSAVERLALRNVEVHPRLPSTRKPAIVASPAAIVPGGPEPCRDDARSLHLASPHRPVPITPAPTPAPEPRPRGDIVMPVDGGGRPLRLRCQEPAMRHAVGAAAQRQQQQQQQQQQQAAAPPAPASAQRAALHRRTGSGQRQETHRHARAGQQPTAQPSADPAQFLPVHPPPARLSEGAPATEHLPITLRSTHQSRRTARRSRYPPRPRSQCAANTGHTVTATDAWCSEHPRHEHIALSRLLQALSATGNLDEAADLLMKSKTNVRMVVSKLEVDLGRHLDLPTVPGPTAADEGKLLLVRLPKRSRSQLTGAGARLVRDQAAVRSAAIADCSTVP